MDVEELQQGNQFGLRNLIISDTRKAQRSFNVANHYYNVFQFLFSFY